MVAQRGASQAPAQVGRHLEQAVAPQDQPDSAGPVLWTFLRRKGDTAPACTVCGRQDETLRIVSYPFVVSLLVVTFRRAFTGLWCARHRRLYLFLAGAITGTLGWLGIPFGFYYTPLALVKLALGGEQPAGSNVHMLAALSEFKSRTGDSLGAMRCLEACLRFREDPNIQASLRESSMRVGMSAAEDPALAIPAAVVLCSSILIGFFAGLLDYVTSFAFSEWTPDQVSAYVFIFSWACTVLWIFFGGLVLFDLIEWGLASLRSRQRTFGILLAVVSAALVFYFLLSGEAAGRYLVRVFVGHDWEPLGDTIITLGAVLTRGGLLTIPEMVRSGGSRSVLYMVVLSVGAVYFAAIGITTALRVVRWQRRIAAANVAFSNTADSGLNWLALTAIPVAVAGLALFYPQQGVVDYFDSIQRNRQGFALLQAKDAEQAIPEFNIAIAQRPAWVVPHINLGLALSGQQKYDEAMAEFRQAIRLDPDVSASYTALGDIYLRQRNYPLAAEMYLESIKRDPESGYVHRNLGAVYLEQKNYMAARDTLEVAVRLGPKDVTAFEALGMAHLRLGDEQAAGKAFETAIALNPKRGATHAELGLLLLDQGQLEEAASHLFSALDLSPTFSSTHYGLGRLYASRGETDKAISSFQQAIALTPRSLAAYDGLCDMYRTRGEYDRIIAALQALTQGQPAWSLPHALLAGVHFEMDQTELSERELQSAKELAGDDPDAFYYLASAYTLRHEFDQAEAHMRRAIDLSPEVASYYRGLASVLLAEQKFDEGLRAADQALTLHKDYMQARVVRAQIFLEQEQFDQALAELKQARKTAPGSVDVHSSLSLLYLQQGRNVEALDEAKELMRLARYSAAAQRSLAFAYYAQGETDLALKAAHQAVKISPKSDSSHFILGLSWMSKGDRKQAISEFEKFLSLYWDRPHLREYKAKAEAYLTQLRSATH